MNKRFVISVVVVFVASMVLGMVVHGMLLGADYGKLVAAGLFRAPEDAQKHFPYMLLAHVFLAIGYTWIYRKGRDISRPWFQQGARFGIAVALITVIPTYLIYFAVQPMPVELVAKQIVLDFIAVLALGVVTAAVNRDPAVARA
jgi:hypothetical protein